MRIAILGFGLIGGSIARAVRQHRPDWTVAAWSPTGAGPGEALRERIVDDAPVEPAEAVAGADLVVIAAPPLATLDVLEQLAGPLRPHLAANVTVTDVASTKRRIVAHAQHLRLPFAGGHPMAGSDATGYGAAVGDLFEARPWVVVPGSDVATSAVELLAEGVGAAPIRLDAETHDAAVAAISHLPLVLAATLVEVVAGRLTIDGFDPRRLAAGGWRDMTRLARGDPEMGAGMLATNADEIASLIRAAREALDGWLTALEASGPADEPLRRRLAEARASVEPPA